MVTNYHGVHKAPRKWSNVELARFAPLFTGVVVNVSAWEDKDKQGGRYRDYFRFASQYWVTNYKADMRGESGLPNEIFLDLESDLPLNMEARFDVVFNHTTLEHVYDFHKALDNLTSLSNDVLIIVVPIMQQVHVIPDAASGYNSEYGDFWRFTPQAIERLLAERGMHICYMSFNTHRKASVYAFCIATKNPEKWQDKFPMTFSHVDNSAVGFVKQPWAGCNAFRDQWFVERCILFLQAVKRSCNRVLNRIIGR